MVAILTGTPTPGGLRLRFPLLLQGERPIEQLSHELRP